MNKFNRFCNKFSGHEAYIVGTGPSLDAFDMKSIPDDAVVIPIHRAIVKAKVNAAKTFWLVIDDIWQNGTPGDWDKWLYLTEIDNGIVGVFRYSLLTGKGFRNCPVGPNIIKFMTPYFDDRSLLQKRRDVIGKLKELYAVCGTVCPAIHFAWYLGCEKIHLIGIDGDVGHAGSLGDVYADDERQMHYQRAKDDGLSVAEELNVTVIDH